MLGEASLMGSIVVSSQGEILLELKKDTNVDKYLVYYASFLFI